MIKTIWTSVFTPLLKLREKLFQFGFDWFTTSPVVFVARTVPAASSIRYVRFEGAPVPPQIVLSVSYKEVIAKSKTKSVFAVTGIDLLYISGLEGGTGLSKKIILPFVSPRVWSSISICQPSLRPVEIFVTAYWFATNVVVALKIKDVYGWVTLPKPVPKSSKKIISSTILSLAMRTKTSSTSPVMGYALGVGIGNAPVSASNAVLW